MKNLNIYLTFDGNCREAIEYYRDCFQGEIVSLQTFKDNPMPGIPDHWQDKVMHCELKAEDIVLMASDNMPDSKLNQGNNYSLSIDLNSAEEQDSIFKQLAEGGKISMELQETFWGSRFGMLTDKFGVHWMLSYDKPQDEEE